jgi:hypothetical protein
VEHGIYRLGAQAKAQHLAAGTLDMELARRAADPSYTGIAEAAAQRIEGGIQFAFRDPGPGFAFQRYLRPDPAQGVGQCGRGITRGADLRPAGFSRHGQSGHRRHGHTCAPYGEAGQARCPFCR